MLSKPITPNKKEIELNQSAVAPFEVCASPASLNISSVTLQCPRINIIERHMKELEERKKNNRSIANHNVIDIQEQMRFGELYDMNQKIANKIQKLETQVKHGFDTHNKNIEKICDSVNTLEKSGIFKEASINEDTKDNISIDFIKLETERTQILHMTKELYQKCFFEMEKMMLKLDLMKNGDNMINIIDTETDMEITEIEESLESLEDYEFIESFRDTIIEPNEKTETVYETIRIQDTYDPLDKLVVENVEILVIDAEIQTDDIIILDQPLPIFTFSISAQTEDKGIREYNNQIIQTEKLAIVMNMTQTEITETKAQNIQTEITETKAQIIQTEITETKAQNIQTEWEMIEEGTQTQEMRNEILIEINKEEDYSVEGTDNEFNTIGSNDSIFGEPHNNQSDFASSEEGDFVDVDSQFHMMDEIEDLKNKMAQRRKEIEDMEFQKKAEFHGRINAKEVKLREDAMKRSSLEVKKMGNALKHLEKRANSQMGTLPRRSMTLNQQAEALKATTKLAGEFNPKELYDLLSLRYLDFITELTKTSLPNIEKLFLYIKKEIEEKDKKISGFELEIEEKGDEINEINAMCQKVDIQLKRYRSDSVLQSDEFRNSSPQLESPHIETINQAIQTNPILDFSWSKSKSSLGEKEIEDEEMLLGEEREVKLRVPERKESIRKLKHAKTEEKWKIEEIVKNMGDDGRIELLVKYVQKYKLKKEILAKLLDKDDEGELLEAFVKIQVYITKILDNSIELPAPGHYPKFHNSDEIQDSIIAIIICIQEKTGKYIDLLTAIFQEEEIREIKQMIQETNLLNCEVSNV